VKLVARLIQIFKTNSKKALTMHFCWQLPGAASVHASRHPSCSTCIGYSHRPARLQSIVTLYKQQAK
jgi:hypothetical protein